MFKQKMLVVAITIVFLTSFWYTVQAGSPKIHLPETEYDFGIVPQGSKVTHKFIIKNNGDAPLKLIKAKGS